LAPDDPTHDHPTRKSNPFLRGYTGRFARSAASPPCDANDLGSANPTVVRVESPRTPWLTLVLSLLGVCAASATSLMLYRQSESMDRQIALIEKQNQNFVAANRAAIDVANGTARINEGNALIAEGKALVRQGQSLAAQMSGSAPITQPTVPPAAPPTVTREEFERATARTNNGLRETNNGLRETKDGLRDLRKSIDDLRASFPQSGSVQETAMRRYQIKLTGGWTEAERRDLKRRWADACGIDVNAIVQVLGGYEFQSRDCATGTFDELTKR
jgi:hypothetical protein